MLVGPERLQFGEGVWLEFCKVRFSGYPGLLILRFSWYPGLLVLRWFLGNLGLLILRFSGYSGLLLGGEGVTVYRLENLFSISSGFGWSSFSLTFKVSFSFSRGSFLITVIDVCLSVCVSECSISAVFSLETYTRVM